jgi:hypothetical protein
VVTSTRLRTLMLSKTGPSLNISTAGRIEGQRLLTLAHQLTGPSTSAQTAGSPTPARVAAQALWLKDSTVFGCVTREESCEDWYYRSLFYFAPLGPGPKHKARDRKLSTPLTGSSSCRVLYAEVRKPNVDFGGQSVCPNPRKQSAKSKRPPHRGLKPGANEQTNRHSVLFPGTYLHRFEQNVSISQPSLSNGPRS